MNRLIPVWTDGHARTILIVAHVAAGMAVIAHGQDLLFSLLVAALFVLAVVIGIVFDWLFALAIGFACATVLFFLIPPAISGDALALPTGALTAFFFVSTALAAQFAGNRAQQMEAPPSDAPVHLGSEAPVFGSMGLLSAEVGEMRLQEEIDRARRYGPPLSVGRIAIDYHKEVGPEERAGISRAVARLFESMLRLTDVAYAYDTGSIVAILPHTEEEGAWWLLSRMTDVLLNATFAARDANTRLALRDYATPHFAVVGFPRHGDSATELLDATQDMIQLHRDERSLTHSGLDAPPEPAPHRVLHAAQVNLTHQAALAEDSFKEMKENDTGPDDRTGNNHVTQQSENHVSHTG